MFKLPPEIISAAQASHKKFYPKGPFVSVSLAQFGCESAWGKSLAGTFNPFGIKANADQIARGEFTDHWTKEWTGERYISIVQKFANYTGWENAFDAHATLLVSSHYRDCVQAPTPEEYCQALHEDGYATEPNYASILINIINSGNLKQYDPHMP